MILAEIVEKIETHIVYMQKVFPENCAVYEITWKNMVETDRPQMAI